MRPLVGNLSVLDALRIGCLICPLPTFVATIALRLGPLLSMFLFLAFEAVTCADETEGMPTGCVSTASV